MPAYYNEFDPYAAQWLRNLIVRGLIAPGDVDERSIIEVQPDDLRGYEQCHFFAGIGGWSYALRLAGWADDRPVWTGSCPCQPFSVSGFKRGFDDERHLWPEFFRLISERRPAMVFGEQVAGRNGLAWLDHVFDDLEGSGYACGAANLPACSVGADHKRERLFWLADSDGGEPGQAGEVQRGREHGQQQEDCFSDPWGSAAVVAFSDGRNRRIESGLLPLVDGIPNRLGRLRAYGNAIVPQVAAAFVTASLTHNAEVTGAPHHGTNKE